MSWIFIALLGPAFHAAANILDTYFTNRMFKNTRTLIFYAACTNFLFIPFVFLFAHPSLPPLRLVPFILLNGLIEIIYLYPYYQALRKDDTSIVVSLFDLGRLFVPLLAYLLVGETLAAHQYLGFFIIILASTLLALDYHGKKLKLNAAFGLMLITSFLLALQVVIYKYLFDNVSWSTGFVWPSLAEFGFALLFLTQRDVRIDIAKHWKRTKHSLPLFGLEEFFTFAGTAAGTYAISIVPVTLVESIDSFQPMFVLLYGILLHRFLPGLSKEKVDAKRIVKKCLLFLVMFFGAWLIVH